MFMCICLLSGAHGACCSRAISFIYDSGVKPSSLIFENHLPTPRARAAAARACARLSRFFGEALHSALIAFADLACARARPGGRPGGRTDGGAVTSRSFSLQVRKVTLS